MMRRKEKGKKLWSNIPEHERHRDTRSERERKNKSPVRQGFIRPANELCWMLDQRFQGHLATSKDENADTELNTKSPTLSGSSNETRSSRLGQYFIGSSIMSEKNAATQDKDTYHTPTLIEELSSEQHRTAVTVLEHIRKACSGIATIYRAITEYPKNYSRFNGDEPRKTNYLQTWREFCTHDIHTY